MLIAVKSFEIFPKHKLYFFSESFALNWYIFVALSNKKSLLPLKCKFLKNVLFDWIKLIGYLVSAVNVVSTNPCVGPSTRNNISFPLLSICIDEFISAPKINTFFPMLPPGNENAECKSNPMP